MRRILVGIFLCVLIVLIGYVFPQASTQPNSKPSHYFLVLLNRPAGAPQLSKEAAEKLQEEHMANIRVMAAEHKLLIAGPCLDDTALRGIFVFRTDSVVQAQEWADSDPAVKAGRLSPEVHGPWLIDPSVIHSPTEPLGLEQYTLVLMRRGAKWKSDAAAFNLVVKDQPAFVKRMMEQESLAVAGLFPLSVPGELRAVDIFRVSTEQTAALLKSDPTIKADLLRPEIHPWGTGKGVLASGLPME